MLLLKEDKAVYKKGQNNKNNYPKPQVNKIEGEVSTSTFRSVSFVPSVNITYHDFDR